MIPGSPPEHAPPRHGMPLQRVRSRLLREPFYRTRLANGLTIIVAPRPGLARKVAILASRYGSLDIKIPHGNSVLDTPPGIAHFLEHQLFKKEGGDLLLEFSRDGADANAYTDHALTAYHFSCVENFERFLTRLFHLVFTPDFSPDRVAREIEIIDQELRMWNDMPDTRLLRSLLESLFEQHPVRIDVGGTRESIRRITPELLSVCHRLFYRPGNVILVLSGDIEPVAAVRMVADLLPSSEPTLPAPHYVLPDSPRARVPKSSLRMDISRPRVLLGFKEPPAMQTAQETFRRELTTMVLLDLLFGRSGPFFTRWYSRGVIDETFDTTYVAHPTFGYATIGVETDRPEEFSKAVLEEIEAHLRRPRFSRRAMERTRRKAIGRYLKAMDSAEQAAFLALELQLREATLDDAVRLLRGITQERLSERLSALFRPESLAVSMLLPKAAS